MDAACLQCSLRRNLETAQSLGTAEETMEFARELLQLYLDAPRDVPSTWITPQVTQLLHRRYGLDIDRFRQEKLDSNRLVLTAVHPQLASSRGIPVRGYETLFTVSIAVVVTLAMSWVGLMVINSLLVLPAAASRNIARNLREYHLFSVLGALLAGVLGLATSYYLGCSTGAVISLYLAAFFAVTFCLRKTRA